MTGTTDTSTPTEKEESVATFTAQAVETAKEYLRHKYDVDAIFAATGDDRHALLLIHLVHIAAYSLCTKLSTGRMNQIKIDNYNEAMQYLEDVRKDIRNPSFPILADQKSDRITLVTSNTNITDQW